MRSMNAIIMLMIIEQLLHKIKANRRREMVVKVEMYTSACEASGVM